MSREEFLENIIERNTRQVISEALEMTPDKTKGDYVREYYVDHRNGSTVWIRIGILQDITDIIMEKKRIEFERDYDSFTGLLNRHAYYQRIEALFYEKDKLKITAFIMIDLDNLKYVNDTYGHDFGDDYIRTAAMILKKFQNYGGIVSRISGDEFNICLSGFSFKDEVREIINTVRAELLRPSNPYSYYTPFSYLKQ